jgi:hypothetical protein
MVGRAGIARANWALDLTARQQCLTLPSSPRQSCKAFPKGERLERSDSPERRPRLPPSFARRRPTRRLEGWPAIQRSSRAPSLAGGAFWEDARLGSGPTAPVAHATPQVSNQGSRARCRQRRAWLRYVGPSGPAGSTGAPLARAVIARVSRSSIESSLSKRSSPPWTFVHSSSNLAIWASRRQWSASKATMIE